MSLGQDRLQRVWASAQRDDHRRDPRVLARLATSSDPDERLLTLALVRRQIGAGEPPEPYLSIARKLVTDPDNDCRWQALIVVGEAIATNPDSVWEVIAEYGSSPDEDMRTAIATVLLEHLLEAHFDRYFPRVRARTLSGDRLFAEMVSMCWVGTPRSPGRLKIQHVLDVAAQGGLWSASDSTDAV
jgi:hypothetical protein